MKLTYNDSTHAYWLDGKRVKSASKVAKIAADSFTIEQWQKRQVAIGMTLDSTLAERVAVDLENREEIQAVCDAAAEAAKANNAARRGTQRHRVLELLLLGRTDQFITDQQRNDAAVLQRTLDRYHLEPIPDRVEQFVAWPDNGVVGRYDAVVKHDGAPVLVDLKSGENAVKYPHSTGVQLALYAFAPQTSKTIERDGDRSTVEEWWTMPDGLNTEVAYVIYASDDHDVGELWRIDIQHGLVGAHLALSIVDWRKKHNYGRDMAAKIQSKDANSSVDHGVGIGDGGSPEGSGSTRDRPPAPSPARPRNLPPARPTPPAEGGTVNDADIKALSARFDKLSDPAKEWTGNLIKQGRNGHDWKIRGNPTVRRYGLYRGVIQLAETGLNDDDIIRSIVSNITNTYTPDHTPGQALSQLDATQAAEFAVIVHGLSTDRYRLTWQADGPPQLEHVA